MDAMLNSAAGWRSVLMVALFVLVALLPFASMLVHAAYYDFVTEDEARHIEAGEPYVGCYKTATTDIVCTGTGHDTFYEFLLQI